MINTVVLMATKQGLDFSFTTRLSCCIIAKEVVRVVRTSVMCAVLALDGEKVSRASESN